ncbi:MAG: NERD domain-containing protein [Campylobacter sp.]|uniref:NERD domain-containing protein n=1 Tax=Campylobacter sp. TaxID=205 RepID=UPI0028D13DA9|nr:NERD domain-containing protein [uncultured Campylobacter sp.]
MAILIPERKIIEQQKVLPTNGEMAILNFLEITLNDEYEIYYQPYLNGKNPDIVLMRKGGGVLIIEVKDWNLTHYYIDNSGDWRLRENNAYITSPFHQVEIYKNKLQNMNYRFLYENFFNKNIYGVIRTAVYFHCESRESVLCFLKGQNINRYVQIIGRDSLNSSFFNSLLNSTYIGRVSKYFNDELYKSIKRYLKPTFHQLEINQEVIYTKEQEELTKSRIGKRQKIKGVAGSGKTLVLAKRAVNAHIRTHRRVLVLTFNISLVNYIHDQISKVRESFAWKNFYITNYHSFFREFADQYGLKITGHEDFDNKEFFSSRQNSIKKFDAIFIDEIQDYKQEWLNLIVVYFSKPDTEIVVFGDEKQNIYDRELDENKEIITTGIVGRWNKSLKKSFRLNHDIGRLAIEFQKEFLDNKYILDEMLIAQQEFDFEPSVIEYHEIGNLSEINDMVFKFIELHNIHSNDVAILGDNIGILRELDFEIRSKYQEETITTFEMKEEYKELEKNGLLTKDNIDQIRRAKKVGFWLNAGMIKLSTVHSFKGWEIHTLFLLIDKKSTFELVYTGITRARQNIVIINLGNTELSNFFSKKCSAKNFY